MTEQQVREGYERSQGRPMPKKDFDAFVRLSHLLGADEASSYEEAKDIMISSVQVLPTYLFS